MAKLILIIDCTDAGERIEIAKAVVKEYTPTSLKFFHACNNATVIFCEWAGACERKRSCVKRTFEIQKFDGDSQ